MRFAYSLAAVVGLVLAVACGSSSSGSGSNGGSGNSAGNSSTSGGTTGSGGSGNVIGAAGDLGEGGADLPPVVSTASPHGAGALVAGGVIAHSANFTGVFSLGQAPGGNGVLTSATKQLRGGVIGATQK